VAFGPLSPWERVGVRGSIRIFSPSPTHHALFFKEEILLISLTLTLALSQEERG
jgi:hypothetical protein